MTRGAGPRLTAILVLVLMFSLSACSRAVSNYIAGFETIGSSFSPMVECDGRAPQLFEWLWSDNTVSTNYPATSIDFGSAAVRQQYLMVSPASAVTKINLGFDASDGGWTNQYGVVPPQGVAAVYFPQPLTNLQYWSSAYNPITNTLDFSGFTALQNVECWHCSNLQHVAVANLPGLRRVCVEGCNLQKLDLSGNPNLEDVRGALNRYSGIVLGGGTGPKVWHWCLRDNPQITQNFQAILTNFYSLQEAWFWNANQSGALRFVSSNLTDVQVYGNRYTSADFSGQSNLWALWIQNNVLTNLVIDGCRSLQTLKVQGNQLPTQVLDRLLIQLDTTAPALSYVDLAHNAGYPSAVGYAHYAFLIKRGVTVHLGFPTKDFKWPIIVLGSMTLVSAAAAIGRSIQHRKKAASF